MANETPEPQTFVEMVLALLEDRFPWLGTDEPASPSETVVQLNELHDTLRERRAANSDKGPNHLLPPW